MRDNNVLERREIIDKLLYVIPIFIINHIEVHSACFKRKSTDDDSYEYSPRPTYRLVLNTLPGVDIVKYSQSFRFYYYLINQ